MAANFTADFQSLKSSFSLLDIDQNMENSNHFPQMNPSDLETSHMNLQSLLGLFSHDNNFLPPGPEFSGNFVDNFPGFFNHEKKNVVSVSSQPNNSAENNLHKGKKRKSVETPETSTPNCSPSVSENVIKRKNSSGKGKRAKSDENEEKQSNDVVHIRARRGQATDSHSLAERVRRGKINERLKCLQSIVPGCYKTMGMAGMLDEIINYVQSLQNQVEFLSMKLTAASTFHDFNSEADIIDALQRAKVYEAMQMQKVARGGGYEQGSVSQVGQFDLSFVSYPQLPHNR